MTQLPQINFSLSESPKHVPLIQIEPSLKCICVDKWIFHIGPVILHVKSLLRLSGTCVGMYAF